MQNYDWRPNSIQTPLKNDISDLGPLKLFMGVFRVSILTLRLIFVCAQITTSKTQNHIPQKTNFSFFNFCRSCHPSAHGVFRLIAQLLSESIIWHDPKIGLLHRSTEILVEKKISGSFSGCKNWLRRTFQLRSQLHRF